MTVSAQLKMESAADEKNPVHTSENQPLNISLFIKSSFHIKVFTFKAMIEFKIWQEVKVWKNAEDL